MAEVAATCELPEAEQVRTEIQALLAGIDLYSQTITIGKLRGDLEKRLGLSVGALCGKRSKKQVAKILQDEVQNKLKSNDFEKIARALREYGEYPSHTKNMLLEGLPHALSRVGGVPHAHQVRFLSIVHDALVDARRYAQDRLTACEGRVDSAQAELCEREHARDDCVEALKDARADAAEKKLSLGMAERAEADDEEEHRNAKRKRQDLAEELSSLQQQREELVVGLGGPLQLLTDGTWQDEKARDSAVMTVLVYLGKMKAENTLFAASPHALNKYPKNRGAFDLAVVDAITGIMNEKVELLDGRLNEIRSNLLGQADVTALTTLAMLDLDRAKTADQRAALADSEASVESAVAACGIAESRLSEQFAEVAARKSEQVPASEKVQQLDETLELVSRLMVAAAAEGSNEAHEDLLDEDAEMEPAVKGESPTEDPQTFASGGC